MKLNPIRQNMNEVEIKDKIILFSYKTPVAYYKARVGYAKTNKFWSKTTSKHINEWLRDKGYSKERGNGLREVDQDILDNLLNEVK